MVFGQPEIICYTVGFFKNPTDQFLSCLKNLVAPYCARISTDPLECFKKLFTIWFIPPSPTLNPAYFHCLFPLPGDRRLLSSVFTKDTRGSRAHVLFYILFPLP